MQLLGGLSAEQFLAEYWQKKPLLVRQAVPAFAGMIDPAGLDELACREDAVSRIVRHDKGMWQLGHGPFDKRQLKYWQQGNWSLLVSNLNHFLPDAAELFYRFNFIPYARLDDLMVSYATAGGGVGPHFDSYDVFLLQAGGRKQWQISAQSDQSFIEDAPLRILKHFEPEQEWLLEPGDMLYLPPQYAHNGVALEPGMTYSIGFRAPSAQELSMQFLTYLQDQLVLDGMYGDPDLICQHDPARISSVMIDRMMTMLRQIQWNRDTVSGFLGGYLSEPKSHVIFDVPDDPVDYDEFVAVLGTHGVVLDLKSQMLYCGNSLFLNGENVCFESEDEGMLKQLANERKLNVTSFSDSLCELLYDWYQCGYLQLGS
ncbi:cupin domain-containing protein [Chitinivorax sp. B]|uniref:cupin domain-containing protein n=1 Tax=Chitinivorax sp. B TaxID=2502235 RepID=UPI0020173EAB|nr:cupin domain-containing protein [Chitinivorax sp. B]